MKVTNFEGDFKYLTTEKLVNVTGGQHCYNASCIRKRNQAMAGAGDFLRGFVKGMTNQLPFKWW